MSEDLEFLLQHGMSLDDIHRLLDRDGFTMEQIMESARRIVERGDSLTPNHQEWAEPVPFDTIQTPDFPVDTLPAPVAAFVGALAESTQTPPEMAGILSLGVLATAFQSKYTVQITSDWAEPLCAYAVAVAPPGERKSAVISALTKPLHEFEAEQRELEMEEIAQNEAERDLLEKSLQAAKNKAANGKGDFNAKKQEVLELSAQLARFKELHPYRLLADDSTTEKLVDIMDKQGGGITVCSSEGGIFDMIAGRYDRTANLDVYLKGHSGDSLTVDRIGRKPNHIPNPRVSMILTVQPSVLYGLMDNATFKGRGLCGRFLYSMCKSKVGHREITPPPVPEHIGRGYQDFIRQILSDRGSGTVYLDKDADEVRIEYQRYVEGKLGGEWEHMRDWGGKATGAMVRIAALLHLSSFPASEPISLETMVNATSIAEFLGAHAMAAYRVIGADEAQENAKYLWRRIEATGQSAITRRDLFRLVRGKFKKSEYMEVPLRILAEYGYICIEDVEREGAGRKASPKINVNPLARGQNGQNGQNGRTARILSI